MNSVLLVLTTIATILGTANAATALGYVYNALPWGITKLTLEVSAPSRLEPYAC